MSEIPCFHHIRMDAALAAFDTFAASLELTDDAAKVAPLVARYRAGLYRIVVVGEEKRGKSTFIAALLETAGLLPTGNEPMTAAVFKIVYGPEARYRVFFLPKDPDRPDESRPPPIDVAASDLAEYGTENGNPNNEKRVDFIVIELPHPLLKAGLTIVDLPGLGGLKQEHSLLTMRYLPKADAVFYVLDSVNKPITSADRRTLERLRKHTDHVIFVQTRTDVASTDKWMGWKSRNIDEIADILEIERSAVENIYFPVSSKLKNDYDVGGDEDDLRESGFPALMSHLHDSLVPRIRDRLALPMVEAQLRAVVGAMPRIENEIAITSSNSVAELEKIESMLKQIQQDHDRWKKTTLPTILQRFEQDFDDAVESTRRRIASELDAGSYGALVSGVMREAEAAGHLSGQQILDNACDWADAVLQNGSDALSEISAAFDRQAQDAFQTAARKIGEQVSPVVIRPTGDGGLDVPRETKLSLPGGGWTVFQQVRNGTLTGGGLAGGVFYIASLIFPPLAVATAVVSFLGALFGGRRAYEDARERQREQALSKLRQFLADTARRLNQQATLQFTAASRQLHRDMRAELDGAITKHDSDGAANLDAVRRQRQQSQEASRARLKTLREHQALANAVLARLRDAGTPLDAPEREAAA